MQYLYEILQTHGLSPALGACSSSASEFVLNINRAGSNAGLGTFALYFQLHDGLARRRGDRSVEHDLHAKGTTKWALNSSTASRLLNTNGRKLLCHACNTAFKAADTAMHKFVPPGAQSPR